MSYVRYNGSHGLCFWETNTTSLMPKFSWEDFHLIPAVRPSIALPTVNYSIINIPKSSKRVNITNYLPGGQTYDGRSGRWEFIIDHTNWETWSEAYNQLTEFFHGKRLQVALNDESSRIFEGRFRIEQYTPGESYSAITIQYDLDPDEITDSGDHYYRIRFLSEEGAQLQVSYMVKGDIPAFSSAISDPNGEYTVDGYEPYVRAVTENTDYIVKRTALANKHAIRFVDADGTIYKEVYQPSNLQFGIKS